MSCFDSLSFSFVSLLNIFRSASLGGRDSGCMASRLPPPGILHVVESVSDEHNF